MDEPPEYEDTCYETSHSANLSKGNLLVTKSTMTFMLVGETGAGKTAFVDLITNILRGIEPTVYQRTHSIANEAGGLKVGSQTNEPLLYEFTSLNGVIIRVLDTPGLADTRGMEYDEGHKARIARVIGNTIPAIDGILIVANGTTERLQAATDYAVTTLASIFPRSIADNIAILFTMVSHPMACNFQLDSLPESLRNSENYNLDNPIALMKRYRELEQQAQFKHLPKLLKIVNDAHNNAVDTLADFFDWLDRRTVQRTAAIVELHDTVCTIERNIHNVLVRMNMISKKKRDIEELSDSTQPMNIDELETVMNRPVKTQITTSSHNTLCLRPDCYSNCHIECSLAFSLDPEIFNSCSIMADDGSCSKCQHLAVDHHHTKSLWEDTNGTQVEENIEAAEHDKSRYQSALKAKASVKRIGGEIEDLKAEIGRLCDLYQSLSLSGSFAGQISKMIRHLELNLAAQRANGADSQTIEVMENSIDKMRQKKRLVDEAAAAARRESVYVVPT